MGVWSEPTAPTRSPSVEGYEVTDIPLQVPALNKELLAWERVYNTVRPHQSLGYLTPLQFLAQWQHQREEVKCH